MFQIGLRPVSEIERVLVFRIIVSRRWMTYDDTFVFFLYMHDGCRYLPVILDLLVSIFSFSLNALLLLVIRFVSGCTDTPSLPHYVRNGVIGVWM